MAGPFVGSEGVGAIKTWTEGKLSGKANTSDVYVKTQTYSKAEVDEIIENLNALRVLNKGVVNATTSTVQDVCTQYVQTNYSRTPEDHDCIIVTLTDKQNDKVNYMYSSVSSAWIDIGSNSMVVQAATDTVAGILKLVNNVTSDATDTAPTVAAVKAAIATLTQSLSTLTGTVSSLNTAVQGKASQTDLEALETTVQGKADTTTVQALSATVGTKANAADVYPKTQTYSRTEVDSKIQEAGVAIEEMTSEEVLAILNGTAS